VIVVQEYRRVLNRKSRILIIVLILSNLIIFANVNITVDNIKNSRILASCEGLTIDEAVEYSGVSREGLLKMINQNDCPFVLRLGHRRLIKRRAFDEYIAKLDFVE